MISIARRNKFSSCRPKQIEYFSRRFFEFLEHLKCFSSLRGVNATTVTQHTHTPSFQTTHTYKISIQLTALALGKAQSIYYYEVASFSGNLESSISSDSASSHCFLQFASCSCIRDLQHIIPNVNTCTSMLYRDIERNRGRT